MDPSIRNVDELNGWLAERHLNGHWQGSARPAAMQPYLWKWADIYDGLMKATEVVPIEHAERRTIQLRNPSLGDRMTNTVHISVQCVMPGEIAPAHRHNAAAVRFVVKGSKDAFTVVEGEAIPMEEGDLITTPNWTWHDHFNNSSEPVIWLDGLDIRLVSLSRMFQEAYPAKSQPIEKPAGFVASTLGHVRPRWLQQDHRTPPFRYKWADTRAALDALKAAEAEDAYDGLHLTYSHPVTGGPTLPTFACEVQALRPRSATRSHRHSSTTIYQAFRGSGTTTIEGEEFKWEQGDIFVVPPWHWHAHENTSDTESLLFSITDRPAFEALEIFREEAASDGPSDT